MTSSNFLHFASLFILNFLLVQGQSESCSGGLSNKNFFTPSSRPFVCEQKCTFRVTYAGFPAGTRSRTVYKCCNGADPVKTSLFYSQYSCPATVKPSTPQPTTRPPVRVTLPLPQTTRPPVPQTTLRPVRPTRLPVPQTTLPPVRPTRLPVPQTTLPPVRPSTGPPRQVTPRPPTARPTQPRQVTVQPTATPASGCPNGANSLNFFPDTKNVCLFQCEFRVSIQGQPAGTRTNTRYSCCDGSEPKVVNRIYNTLSCA